MRVSDTSSYTYADLENFLCKFLGISVKDEPQTKKQVASKEAFQTIDGSKIARDRLSQHQNTEGNSTLFVSNPPTNYTSLSIKKNELDKKEKSPPTFELATDQEVTIEKIKQKSIDPSK